MSIPISIFIFSLILMLILIAEGCEKTLIFFTGMCVTSMFWIISNHVQYNNVINAMEVYRGKTTLEYKVVDGEIVDSTVIYKPKHKNDTIKFYR